MATGVSGVTLVAPKSFAIVEPGLFRSAVFSREHFGFVRHLKLRTMVYLAAEEAPKALRDFCTDEEINFINLGTMQAFSRSTEWSPLRGDLSKVALEHVLDANKLPLMIVCLNGVDQTGALVGCLRKLQGWSFASIVEEHRRFCEASGRSFIEHYIEFFDVDMISYPKQLPDWFASDLAEFRLEESEVRRARQQKSSPTQHSLLKKSSVNGGGVIRKTKS